MTSSEAHEVLDRAQTGADLDSYTISAALVATGDLHEDDIAIQIKRPAGTWERKSSGLAPASWLGGIA